MKAFLEKVFDMLRAARYALWQQQVAVPDYWNGARTAAARCALLALVLFAGVLLVRLCMLLLRRKRSPRRILTVAATLGAVLGLCVWAFFPQPVAVPGAVESVSLVRLEGRRETDVPLSLSEQKALTALLETAQCRRGFAAALPEPEGTGYRIICETASGETAVLVGPETAVRYTSAEKGLLYPVLSAEELYKALAALEGR